MYVGSHYNSYYNTLFGNRGSVYGAYAKNAGSNALSFMQANRYNQNTLNSDSVRYVQNIKQGAGALKTALGSLTTGNAFRQKTAVSSNTDVLTVETNRKYANQTETTVRVEQVATGQKNEGNRLSAKGQTALSGYQQFEIETNGKNYQFSFEVQAGDTNRDVQRKMVEAINQRGIGLTASVSENDSTSVLTISANGTGDAVENRFAIRDLVGGAVATTGAFQVIEEAQNANYRVNDGSLLTSKSNKIDLGNGLTATLKKASSEDVTIRPGTDREAAVQKVQELADAYNQLYGAALTNTSDDKATKLFSQLVSISRTYAGSLSDLGINFDENGYMRVDKEALGSAISDGSLERFFTENNGRNYGFANQLGRLASEVSNNPARFVSQDSLSHGSQSGMSSFPNSFQLYNMQTQMNNMGMLFDFWL